MLKFFEKLFKRPPTGLHIAASPRAVVLVSGSARITVTPELALQLAEALPRYAQISKALGGSHENAVL